MGTGGLADLFDGGGVAAAGHGASLAHPGPQVGVTAGGEGGDEPGDGGDIMTRQEPQPAAHADVERPSREAGDPARRQPALDDAAVVEKRVVEAEAVEGEPAQNRVETGEEAPLGDR